MDPPRLGKADHLGSDVFQGRSLVLKRGKVMDRFHFSIGSIGIPSVIEKPVKVLGKTFDCSLKGAAFIRVTDE